MIIKQFEHQKYERAQYIWNNKIAILTDSSSSIYQIKHDYDNIFMIDLPCFIGDVMFSNFAQDKDDLFFDALENTSMIAKTSQPSVGETLKKFEEIKKKDILILSIFLFLKN